MLAKIGSMAQTIPDGSRYGIEVGTRWRDVSNARTVIVVWVQRSGVVVYRQEGAAPDDERVTNVVRFVETFAPLDETGSWTKPEAADRGQA
jgi:hypothetical protein